MVGVGAVVVGVEVGGGAVVGVVGPVAETGGGVSGVGPTTPSGVCSPEG